jgi:hypothetical protein
MPAAKYKRLTRLSPPAAVSWALVAGAVLWLAAEQAQAETTTIICNPCSEAYQRWVDDAEVPTPSTTLTVLEQPCPIPPISYPAHTCTSPEAAIIWFGDGGRQTFYHELGHNLDYQMPTWVRERYMGILGRTGEWVQPSVLHHSPNELFAESYALCAFKLWVPRGGAVQGQSPVGGRRVHNRVCRLIRLHGDA